jgi:prolyl-tRNA editing enzyme YbaK/EbsC (Cys-tRNA(Pro) deacylase)
MDKAAYEGSVQTLRTRITEQRINAQVMELPEGFSSASDFAKLAGVPLTQVALPWAFLDKTGDRIVMAITRGDLGMPDKNQIQATLSLTAPPKGISDDQTLKWTGFRRNNFPPFGFPEDAPILVVIDQTLVNQGGDIVSTAAGDKVCVRTTVEEILRVTQAIVGNLHG